MSAIAPGVDGPGGLWAAGPDYKVSLHDGFVFMPYVGPTLPHQPLRWRTVSAQLGGIELQSRDASAPTWSALRCAYDLGGIVECYELRDGGVEQSFVIELRPDDGDLVIAGLVDSPLELTPRAWQRAPLQLRLPDDGRAVIEYGAATAIDALGNAPGLGIDVTQEANPLLHKLGPQVAGFDGRYCLIYTTRPFSLPQPKPTTAQGRSIWAQRIDVDHANDIGSLPHAVVQLDSLRSDELTIGGVAFDHVSASHFALSTRNLGSGECRVRKLGYRAVEVENFVVDPGTQTTLHVGGVAFNGSRREFLHGFGGNDGSAAGNELLAARLTYDQVTQPVTYGIGCGAGIFAELSEMESKQQIGSQCIAFVLNHAPFDGAGYLLMSTGTASIPMALYGMPGCELLVDPAAGVFLGVVDATITAGKARVVLDVPETIAPLRVTAQWLYAAPGANLAGLQASTGLDLSLAR